MRLWALNNPERRWARCVRRHPRGVAAGSCPLIRRAYQNKFVYSHGKRLGDKQRPASLTHRPVGCLFLRFSHPRAGAGGKSQPPAPAPCPPSSILCVFCPIFEAGTDLMRTPRGCCLPGCFTQPEAQKCSLPGMWGTNSPPCPRPPLHRGEFHIPLCTGISAPLSPLGVSQPRGAKRKAIKSPIKPAGVGVVQPGGLDHLGKPQILTPPNFVVPPGLAYILSLIHI